MAKITYLFGAGASANAIPVVATMRKSMKQIIDTMKEKGNFHYTINHDRSWEEDAPVDVYSSQMIEDLEWLYKESAHHASVDTLAKKFTILGDYKSLKRLKLALSIYFIVQQAPNKVDLRYDSFFASLISSDGIFPDEVNIITWNYDLQFELAYSSYTPSNDILEIQRNLNIKTKNLPKRKTGKFSIYKLNGTSGYHSVDKLDTSNFLLTSNRLIETEIHEILLKGYAEAKYKLNVVPTLSFAWENETENEKLMTEICSELKSAEILVIIGYSFPFFNRKIDQELFDSMSRVRKIYYQDLEEKHQSVMDSVISMNANKDYSHDIQHVFYNVEQFLIPYEL